MSKKVEIEVFSDAINAAIIRMPGRHFPGIVVQGDTLFELYRQVKSLADLLKSIDDENLADEAMELSDNVERLYQHYRSVMKVHNLELPFVDQTE
jgi:hypothetical protein